MGEEWRRPEPSMAESQLAELQNMRVLLEEAGLRIGPGVDTDKEPSFGV